MGIRGGSSDAPKRRAPGTDVRFLLLSRARQHPWLPFNLPPHLESREYDVDPLHRLGEFLVRSSTLSLHVPKCARDLVVGLRLRQDFWYSPGFGGSSRGGVTLGYAGSPQRVTKGSETKIIKKK